MNMNRHEWLRHWLDRQTFSSWSAFQLPGHAKPPPRAIRDGGRIIPRHPDGFNFGNDEVHACIGLNKWGGEDLTRMDVLIGQGRNIRVLGSATAAIAMSLCFRTKQGVQQRLFRDFPEQRLRRVSKTAVVASSLRDALLDVTMVDFAPKQPDINAVIRIVSVRNHSSRPVAGLRVQMLHQLRAAQRNPYLYEKCHARLIRCNRLRRNTEGLGDLAILGDVALYMSHAVGRDQNVMNGNSVGGIIQTRPLFLAPGDEISMAFCLIPVGRDDVFRRTLRKLAPDGEHLERRLSATQSFWNAWLDEVPIRCSDRELEELIESILCLLKCFERKDGYHCCLAGMDRFYDLAVIRDNYWIQRGLAEAGRIVESRKDFENLHRLWRRNGLSPQYVRLASGSNRQPDVRGGSTYGGAEPRVEVPAYYILMCKEACLRAGADPRNYYALIKDAMDAVVLTSNNLQTLQSDETWIWACSFNGLDYMLDNSLLLMTAADFARDAARATGHSADMRRFGALAAKVRRAIDRHMYSARRGRYVYAMGGDGLQDEMPVTNVLNRFVTLSCSGMDRRRVYQGIMDCWRHLNYAEGIRSDPRSAEITGNSPGYALFSMAEFNFAAATDLIGRIKNYAAATGCVWELSDMYAPRWAAEKRRAWDSAVVLMGIVHYLFGIRPDGASIWFNPHLPSKRGWGEIRNFPIGADRFDLGITTDGVVINRNGKRILSVDMPVTVEWMAHGCHIHPQLPTPPLASGAPLTFDWKSFSITPGPCFSRIHVTLPEMGIEYKQNMEATGLLVMVRCLKNPMKIRIGRRYLTVTRQWHRQRYASTSRAATNSQIEFVDMNYAARNKFEPHEPFRLTGYAGETAPTTRVREIFWNHRRRSTHLDRYGWFDIRLNSGVSGEKTLKCAGQRAKVTVRRQFVKHIDDFFRDAADCCIFHEDSLGHAREIALRLLLHKNIRIPVMDWREAAACKDYPKRIIISRHPPPGGGGNFETGDNYMATHNRRGHDVWINNNGHVYKDTRGFLYDLATCSAPHRPAPAFWCEDMYCRLARLYGVAMDDCLKCRIAAGVDISMHCGAYHCRTKNAKTTLDLREAASGIPRKPARPYVMVSALDWTYRTPCSAMKILVVEADADEHVAVDVKIDLPQGVCLFNTRSRAGQWERTLDPVKLIRNADGSQQLRYKLHPGRDVHDSLRNPLRRPSWRSVRLSVAKFGVVEMLVKKRRRYDE